MKRPAFQFYTKDWRTNPKLRRCSPAARGVWVDLMCLLHDAEEYGVLRWPLKDLASSVGASMAHVRELVDKGVLKGSDQGVGPYIYTPKHAGKLGDPVVLVEASSDPCWYCSRFVRDEWVRGRRGENTRFDENHQPPSRSPTRTIGERQGDGPPVSNLLSPTSGIPQGPAGPSADAKPRPSRKCPKAFEVTPDLVQWANEHVPGIPVAGLQRETDKFRDHTFAHAITDWVGAWRNWMRRAAEGRGYAMAGPVNKQEALEQRNGKVAADWAAQPGHSNEGQ